MKLTITNGKGIFDDGDVFNIYGEGFDSCYILDDDDEECTLGELVSDAIEFNVTEE